MSRPSTVGKNRRPSGRPFFSDETLISLVRDSHCFATLDFLTEDDSSVVKVLSREHGFGALLKIYKYIRSEIGVESLSSVVQSFSSSNQFSIQMELLSLIIKYKAGGIQQSPQKFF